MNRPEKRKNYILDTNVLMHDPWSFTNFVGNNVYIPVAVLEELDHLKTRDGIAGYQAREAVRALHRTIDGFGRQCVTDGIGLGGGIVLSVIFPQPGILEQQTFSARNNDNEILACAVQVKEQSAGTETILVSKDVCLRIKAEVCGVTSQDYETDKIKTDELYSGYKALTLSQKNIQKIYDGGLKPPKTRRCSPTSSRSSRAGRIHPAHRWHALTARTSCPCAMTTTPRGV